MTIKALLQAARGLIVQGWTQGAYARDYNERITPYGGPSACKFCMSGAVAHLLGGGAVHSAEFINALRALRCAIDWPVAAWNDTPGRTQDEVLAAFDRAIELLP